MNQQVKQYLIAFVIAFFGGILMTLSLIIAKELSVNSWIATIFLVIMLAIILEVVVGISEKYLVVNFKIFVAMILLSFFFTMFVYNEFINPDWFK